MRGGHIYNAYAMCTFSRYNFAPPPETWEHFRIFSHLSSKFIRHWLPLFAIWHGSGHNSNARILCARRLFMQITPFPLPCLPHPPSCPSSLCTVLFVRKRKRRSQRPPQKKEFLLLLAIGLCLYLSVFVCGLSVSVGAGVGVCAGLCMCVRACVWARL